MKLAMNVKMGISLATVVFVLFFAHPLHPQRAGAGELLQQTTQEHLEAETWWPTKTNAPLNAYAGSSSCTRCHGDQSAGPLSSMQRASVTANHAALPKKSSVWTSSSPSFSYALVSGDGSIDYSVSDGAHKLSQKLSWVMGAGDLGRTFLYQDEGRWYQSEATFYTEPASLDITTGLPLQTGVSLPAALGQRLSPENARSCFGCHTVHATSSAGFDPLHAEAGLGCEACHGPGREHVNRMSDAKGNAGEDTSFGRPGASSVFNPAKLSPSDSIDFCGSCHRTFADASLSLGQEATTAVVRFQPYRLEESKCWRATEDERLTCVACHDPHQPLNRHLASYDTHCLQCHALTASKAIGAHAGKVCPKASADCVTCHMPKVTVASMHGDFTDHFIRVVHAGDPLPR